jgi:hypothetical protein
MQDARYKIIKLFGPLRINLKITTSQDLEKSTLSNFKALHV